MFELIGTFVYLLTCCFGLLNKRVHYFIVVVIWNFLYDSNIFLEAKFIIVATFKTASRNSIILLDQDNKYLIIVETS